MNVILFNFIYPDSKHIMTRKISIRYLAFFYIACMLTVSADNSHKSHLSCSAVLPAWGRTWSLQGHGDKFSVCGSTVYSQTNMDMHLRLTQ